VKKPGEFLFEDSPVNWERKNETTAAWVENVVRAEEKDRIGGPVPGARWAREE